MRHGDIIWRALLIFALAGCTAGDSTYGTVGGHGASHSTASGATHGATSTATAGASSSSTGTSSGASTTGGASTGGSATGSVARLSCPAVLSGCDAGESELLSQVYDATLQTPIGAAVLVDNLENPGMTGVTGQAGIVEVCVPAGTIVAPQIQVNGYLHTIFNDIVMAKSQCFPAIQLFSSSVWSGLSAGIQGFDPSLATVVVSVGRAGAVTCGLSGWTIWAAQADGGPVAASVTYTSGLAIAPAATSTDTEGLAVIFNIDPAVGVVQVFGSQDGGPSSPAFPACGHAPFVNEYNGLVHVAGNGVVSSFSFLTADAG